MRLRPAAAALLLAGTLVSLQACATPEPVPYGPAGETVGGKIVEYGYKDHANADGGHTILVLMPPYSPVADARAFWDRRAEELCPGGVAKRNVFRVERKEIMAHPGYSQYTATTSTRVATGYEVEGYAYCKGAAPTPGAPRP